MGHLGAFLGSLGAVLGPPWALLGASWGHLGHLKMRKVRNIECSKTPVNYRSDWPSGGPREARVGPKLGSSCDLKPSWRQLGGNLAEDAVMMPSWGRLGGNLEATWPNLSRQRGRLGRQEAVNPARLGPARRDAQRPWTHFVRLLTERIQTCNSFYHGRPRVAGFKRSAHSAGPFLWSCGRS